ncbi:MAG: hypothetical protein KDA96_10600 [Planctomycetaceae bacterium]|nr:hypothetical protein [Planctomycetaceae bacterium]
MDPQATWNCLLEAWKTRNWEELQEAATDLKRWMTRGGFPPEVCPQLSMGPLWNRAMVRAACEFVLQMAWQVLQSPNGIPRGLPFSASCCDCNAESPASYEEAVQAGWTGIEFRPDLPRTNFCGYCPIHVPSPPWDEQDWEVASQRRAQ